MFAADSKVDSATTDRLARDSSVVWRQIIGPVEPFLHAVGENLARQVEAFDPGIAPYAEYALNGEGKQLRPVLVGLAAHTLGKTTEAHVTAAVVVEMVHLATLVHDDVMDEGEIRRGQLTLSANWGNEVAVLFGDCLFAQALVLAADYPTTEVCRAVSAATKTVCSGEILQTQRRRDFTLTREDYFKVLEMKTGELFALSCDLSVFLSGASTKMRQQARDFGLALGTAYQLYDDCVDLFGTEAAAGKSLGTDLAKGKLTLPLLIAWEKADAGDRKVLQHLVSDAVPNSAKSVNELLAKYDTLPPSVAVVHQYLHKARQTLHMLPDSSGRRGLLGLIEYLSRQTDALASCA